MLCTPLFIFYFLAPCLFFMILIQVKMMVVLGELGGHDEYSLVEALKLGKVHKPVVAWVSGTCAKLFKSEVQFGHAVSFVSHIWTCFYERMYFS